MVPFQPKSHVAELYITPPVAEREVRFILELNIFQSLAESSPVVDTPAVPIESDTFGPTVAAVPFVMMSSGVDDAIFPNVRADCFELNVVQSVDERAPFWTAEAIARERICPESERPFALPRVTASCA